MIRRSNMKNLVKVYVLFFVSILLTYCPSISAQGADSCKLSMGVNLSAITDFSRELPFANLMKMSRTWYTKGENDPSYTFDTNLADQLSYDANGYPTHIPQMIANEPLPQLVATIWDGTDSWPTGSYTLLWDGIGDFGFWGDYSNLVKVNDNRYEFDYTNTLEGVLELIITVSDISDPVQNIRLLLPGTESTYMTQPFYSDWLDTVDDFATLRFMDWGQTNFWGQVDQYTWQDPTLIDWSERASVDYFTYTTSKGVPYEIIIDLLNHLDLDGWVCIPHRASDNYISEMADLFRDNLETDRHLYVEYSNEIWNWIFGQTQWLNEYSCNSGSDLWPECIVPNIQNALDLWSLSFSSDLDRISRVAAIQTGWLDVSERIAYSLTPGSFDAISPAFYFSFADESEAVLDSLGSYATVTNIAYYSRQDRQDDLDLIKDILTISDSLNVSTVFYEGGQHLTPTPFAVTPSYETALVDIQRDTAMYNLYTEWLDSLEDLNTSTEPMLLMHFSMITETSASFGSWGLLEYMNQDLNLVPAPKYQAIIERNNCQSEPTGLSDVYLTASDICLFPNPTTDVFSIQGLTSSYTIQVLDSLGNLYQSYIVSNNEAVNIDISSLPVGLFLVSIVSDTDNEVLLEKIMKY